MNINFRPTKCIAYDGIFNGAFNDMQPQFIQQEQLPQRLPQSQAWIVYLADLQYLYELKFN